LRKIFTTEVQNFITDKKPAKEALEDAASAWNEVLKKYDAK
jgi:multiple sugar transport system substrate-binding protein